MKESDCFYSQYIAPQSETYLALQTERQNYKKNIDSCFTPIPFLPEKENIKFGAKHPYIPLIYQRLIITGELPFHTKVDSVFDKKLLDALNILRAKTGQVQG
jgi:hypothetical protein